MKHYTGVGSRSTPPHICDLMAAIGRKLCTEGWILRSGGAQGADQAFDSLIPDQSRCEIFIPWRGFNTYDETNAVALDDISPACRLKAVGLMAAVHPSVNRLTPTAKKLHTRNVFQVLGADLSTPSKFLICWTPNGELVGGTRTAIVLAQRAGIPVFNLANESHLARLRKFIS